MSFTRDLGRDMLAAMKPSSDIHLLTATLPFSALDSLRGPTRLAKRLAKTHLSRA
jgi:hypothetical protein